MVVTCLVAAGGGFGFGTWYEGRQEVAVSVRADGTTRHVDLRDGDRVGDALARAGVRPRPGRLTAVVSGRVVDTNYAPADIAVDGNPASLDTPVHDRDVITVEPGMDAVEPTVQVDQAVGPTETIGVMGYLEVPGAPPRLRLTKGVRSGETVGQPVLQGPVAPSRRTDKVVALTFDDGPGPDTDKILDILKAKGVEATFCVIGRMIPERAQDIRRIAAEGHALCNHTQDHDEHLDKAPTARIDEEMDKALVYIAVAGGPRPIFYRPPGGAVSPQVVAEANARQMQELHWSIDTTDWKKPGVDTIVSRALQVSPGSIILLHDGGGDRSQTVAALPTIIDRLRAMGYSFAIPSSTLPGAGPAVNPPLPAAAVPDVSTTTTAPSGSSTTLQGEGA